MKNIAIIGAGQLGSRHLQALVHVQKKINIQVVDSSEDSLKTAEMRFNEVSENFKGTISFHTNISFLEKKLDVVIVATNSKVRRSVVDQLVNHSKIEYLILEKFLFINEQDYFYTEKLFAEKNIKVWVNCPRRLIDFYRKIQKEIIGPIHFFATGNAWGLGCNGIHLLDLFAFLTKSNNIVLSSQLINKEVIESKRSGYIEFTGTITGYADENSFHITSFPQDVSPLHIIINTPKVRYSISEGATSNVWISKLENNWAWEETTFKIPFQSQLTNMVVDDLLENGSCNLTSFKESSTLHLTFLRNLISFLRIININNSIIECPIT